MYLWDCESGAGYLPTPLTLCHFTDKAGRSADLDGWLACHELSRFVCTLRGGVPHIGKDLETDAPLVPRGVGALRDRVEALRPLFGTNNDLAVIVGISPLADVLESL